MKISKQKIYSHIIFDIYIYKQDLALNNQLGLIYHKPNQSTVYMYIYIYIYIHTSICIMYIYV